jgi:hypothetical protein
MRIRHMVQQREINANKIIWEKLMGGPLCNRPKMPEYTFDIYMLK